MATKFVFSPLASSSLIANVNRLFQPSESQGGSILANQDLCAAFEANKQGLEVELLEFECTEAPMNRQKTSFSEKGDKMVMINPTSMQQRGTAKIKVENVEYTVSMHSVVALSFTETPKQVLLGQVGDITVGRNAGSKWLSLRLPTSPSHEKVAQWATAAIGAIAPPVSEPTA